LRWIKFSFGWLIFIFENEIFKVLIRINFRSNGLTSISCQTKILLLSKPNFIWGKRFQLFEVDIRWIFCRISVIFKLFCIFEFLVTNLLFLKLTKVFLIYFQICLIQFLLCSEFFKVFDVYCVCIWSFKSFEISSMA